MNFETLTQRFYTRFPENPNLTEDALFAVMMALGSRVTDSKIILGSRAPTFRSVQQLEKRFPHTDLSEWGKKRSEFCHYLSARALEKCQRAKIFERPGRESFSALLLVQFLVPGTFSFFSYLKVWKVYANRHD